MRHDSGLLELEEETGKLSCSRAGRAADRHVEVAESGDEDEIERRAPPFQIGDEVLLTIDEPHMYNPGDAVARVDALVITVTGAAPLVGERKLVRIEEIGRSSGLAIARRRHPRGVGRSGIRGGARIRHSAPRPQRRTAPFPRRERSNSGQES